jgi:hypothetical protein
MFSSLQSEMSAKPTDEEQGAAAEQPAANRMFCHSMSTMPIEWLVQVLKWLDTEYLFSIMRTNREWECGIQWILKHRKSLRLCHRKIGCHWEDRFHSALSSFLKYMENVKHLDMAECYDDDAMPLIQAHADKLVSLHVDVAPIFTITFPKLKKLDFMQFDASYSTCFPVLEELEAFEIHNPTHENAFMPNLKKFTYNRQNDAYDCDPGVRQFLTRHADQLVSLKVFEMTNNDHVFSFDNESVVFKKMTHIELDDFTFPSKCPALNSAIIHEQRSQTFSELPVKQMTNMEVYLTDLEEDIKGLILTTISKMEKLQHLAQMHTISMTR